jgi:hypothetical protein
MSKQETQCSIRVHEMYGRGAGGSSVSIVSDYVLDGRMIKVQSPAEARGFFL